LALRPARHAWAHLGAALIVSVAYIAFELIANTEVAGENRYFLRTALLVFTPVLGGIAAAFALAEGGTLRLPIPGLRAALALLARPAVIRGAAGALLVTATVHVMETERFVSAWQTYENAVRSLAMGSTSDPSLGDPRFVSANRLSNRLDGLVWASTTHFLSVVVAPALSPARLVVDPDANYFWLSCKTAAANAVADRAVPLLTRQLVRIHACLHRR
jgi:hypothetical protein